MTYYITQAGKEFLEEGRIGDVVKKVGAKLSKVRKSIYKTKGEKAASKAKSKKMMQDFEAGEKKKEAERYAASPEAAAKKKKAELAARIAHQSSGPGYNPPEKKPRKTYSRAEAWHEVR